MTALRLIVQLWMPEEMLYTSYETTFFLYCDVDGHRHPRPALSQKEAAHSAIHYFTEGNYGCDCNRSLELFKRLKLERDPLPCSDGLTNRVLLCLRVGDAKKEVFRDKQWDPTMRFDG